MLAAHVSYRCHDAPPFQRACFGTRVDYHPGMETLERLGAGDLKAVIASYRDALRAHQDTINRLNVYPVPDGDTGTNMSLTIDSVVNALNGADDLPALCKPKNHGSLMDARAKPGV